MSPHLTSNGYFWKFYNDFNPSCYKGRRTKTYPVSNHIYFAFHVVFVMFFLFITVSLLSSVFVVNNTRNENCTLGKYKCKLLENMKTRKLYLV